MLKSPEDAVIYKDKLIESDLLKIFNNQALAIVVNNYYPQQMCSNIVDNIICSKIEHYENAPSIGRYGMAFYETENNPDKVLRYYSQSLNMITDVRELFSPYLSPIDKLRLELEEIWNSGANIQNIHEKKMFVGLGRLLEPGIEFLPHQDIFHLDATGNIKAQEIKSQIAANIFLKVPNTGGELDLWSNGFNDKEYLNMLDNGSYGISRSKLPAHFVSIKPNPGDLVLFNGRVLHAVRSGSEVRVSFSCFIGYSGINSPLKYWS